MSRIAYMRCILYHLTRGILSIFYKLKSCVSTCDFVIQLKMLASGWVSPLLEFLLTVIPLDVTDTDTKINCIWLISIVKNLN